MAPLNGKRFVRPSDVETQVFDWGTIKWLSEPRMTRTERFSTGVVLIEPGKVMFGTIILAAKKQTQSWRAFSRRRLADC